jgi:hypothetical protein
MNQLDYAVEITEDADTLFTMERQAQHSKEWQRLQLLRLLKSGLVRTISEAAALVGISHSTADRHWRTYKREVLAAMCSLAYKGGQVRLSAESLQRLDKQTMRRRFFNAAIGSGVGRRDLCGILYPGWYLDTLPAFGLQSQNRSPVSSQTRP